jgi:hypothetical protein
VIRLAWLLTAALTMVAAGCGGLPPLVATGDEVACQAVFLSGRWQTVHTIEAVYPDGTRGLLVGVTVLSSPERSLDCTLMTVEGFVLFAAADDGTVQVRRAVPPFDRPGFAAGLLADVRLVLLAPKGAPEAGRTTDGMSVCRYRAADGRTTDIIQEIGGWRLERFDAAGRRQRTVKAHATGGSASPERITLQAHGPGAYQLTLNLISATRLSP